MHGWGYAMASLTAAHSIEDALCQGAATESPTTDAMRSLNLLKSLKFNLFCFIDEYYLNHISCF